MSGAPTEWMWEWDPLIWAAEMYSEQLRRIAYLDDYIEKCEEMRPEWTMRAIGQRVIEVRRRDRLDHYFSFSRDVYGPLVAPPSLDLRVPFFDA